MSKKDPNNNSNPSKSAKIPGQTVIKKGVRASVRSEEKKGKPLRFSNYWITSQTNYKAKTDDDFERFQDGYADALEDVFDRDKFGRFVEFLPPQQDDRWNADTINNFQVYTQLEEGTSKFGGRIHAHIIMEISHFSKIRLDAQLIKEAIQHKMARYGMKGMGILKVKYIPPTMNYLLQYNEKAQLSGDDMSALVQSLKITDS